MKKFMYVMGAILMLMMGIISGCGGSASEDPVVISEETSWKIDDTTVYATITRPDTGTNLPAVVFIAGSGPTDRDWNSPIIPGTNGSAAPLANELASRGYVTIRYDKRVSGPHATENIEKLVGKISMAAHLDELTGAVRTVAERNDVDADKIFILANSEGTLHAVNYWKTDTIYPVAGMVLTSAPGRSTAEVIRSQIAAQLTGYPGADTIMDLYDRAVDEFLATGTMTPDETIPQGIKTLLQSFANPVNMPFTQELLTADLSVDLPDIDIPALVLIGKKDIQINWEVDGGKLQEAASGNSNIEFVFPENANHVLKQELGTLEDFDPQNPNYNDEGTVLDPDTLDSIIEWLERNG